MPPSPQQNANAPLRVSVHSDGQPVPDTATLISATVCRAVNQVPSATLVFRDGDIAQQDFPLSNAATFRPGAKLSLKAGYGDSEAAVIFSGIVTQQRLSISGENDARLTVECRDAAVRMTTDRHNALFDEQSDSEIIRALASAHGLPCDVPSTEAPHRGLVQHGCSDWDFVLARAAVNGLLVAADDGRLKLFEPRADGAAALKVSYGESLMEFRAEQHAEQHAEQDAEQDAERPAPRGRVVFIGSALARVGAVIELEGVGNRFSGAVCTTGLTHRLVDGTWTTEAEFGNADELLAASTPELAANAAGRASRIAGLHVGIVMKADEDPAGEHRIQLRVPGLNIEGLWARLAQAHASNGFGSFFFPEVGDEVVVGWFGSDAGLPVVLGSLYSSQRTPPYAQEMAGHTKAIVTRSRSRLVFDDDERAITLSTPGGNQVVISDQGRSIVLSDVNGNQAALSADGIRLDSPKDIQISAKGAIGLHATGALTLRADADLALQGLNLNCIAQVAFSASGSASAALSAAGQTTIKGAMVMIN